MTTWDQALNERKPVSKMYMYYKSNGTREHLAIHNNRLNKVENNALTAITGALNTSTVKFLTYKDRSVQDAVLIADKGKLKVYNGTNVSEVTPHVPSAEQQTNPGLNDLANLTNFRTMAIKKDRIFVAAHHTVKNRVSFCYIDPNIGSAVYDYFPAPYFFDVATEDNDEIIELKVFRDSLIIFCKRSIWALYGDGAVLTDLELVKINVPNGCISPDSVQEVGNNLFYLGSDHVYSLFSTERSYVSAQVVSDKVEPILDSVSLIDKEKATSIFFDNKYYLSFPSGLTLVYDVSLESWTKFTNVKANSFLVIDGVLYFSSDKGGIHKFNPNKYTDNGDYITFSIKTKVMDFQSPVQQKKLRRLWTILRQWDGYNSTFDMKAFVDQYAVVDLKGLGMDGSSGAVWDLSNWDETIWDFSEVMQNEMKLRQKGKSIQLQISNVKPDEPLSIYGLVFEYKLKRP